MLETRFPRPRGDIGNAATFAASPFAVRYRVVAGASPAAAVRGEDPALLAPFIAAGHELAREGAVALSTSCGFLARWQRELQAALPVPVWSSALLALPQLPRPGVITIEAASLTRAHFEAVGADPDTPVEGIAPASALHRTLLEDRPEIDPADAELQVVAAGRRLLARHPEVQTLLLECTNLPPYAAALQAATGRPVHHVVSLLNERMAAMAAMAAGPVPARGHR